MPRLVTPWPNSSWSSRAILVRSSSAAEVGGSPVVAKRYVELCPPDTAVHSSISRSVDSDSSLENQKSKIENPNGRGYVPADAPVVFVCGLASGLLSILVFYLYLANSEQARTLIRPLPCGLGRHEASFGNGDRYGPVNTRG